MIPFWAIVCLVAVTGMIITSPILGISMYVDLTRRNLKRELNK